MSPFADSMVWIACTALVASFVASMWPRELVETDEWKAWASSPDYGGDPRKKPFNIDRRRFKPKGTRG